MKLKNIGLLGVLAGSIFISACNFGGGTTSGAPTVNPGQRGDITLEAESTLQVESSVVISAYVTDFPDTFTMNFTSSDDSVVHLDPSSCTMTGISCIIVADGKAHGQVTVTADASIPGYNQGSTTLTVLSN